MRKLKRFDLLKVKERLARQKTITQLNEVSSDEKKSKSISDELYNLLSDKSLINEELEATAFIVDRHLVHKMMDQKQVLQNRIEFLRNEKSAALVELNKSKAKLETIEKRKLKTKRILDSQKEVKIEDNSSMLFKRR